MKNLPQESGYYWARTAGKAWWNAIVQVYGDAPFFKIDGYDFCSEKRLNDISQVDEFGNKIREEED
jgi:hypothetical protein